MNRMKIILTVLVVMLITNRVFAQNTDYNKHLAKGKEYEEQKKWIYALGEYFDALELTSFLEAEDAYNAWKCLVEEIKKGHPGYGDFDEFSYVDNWILLLQEYEKYWTDYTPYMIFFDKPDRISLNRETKTADYEMRISLQETEKYKEIKDVVCTGLKKAYSTEWNMKYLEKWPEISVYSNQNDYIQNETPLITFKEIFANVGQIYYYEDRIGSVAQKDINNKDLIRKDSEKCTAATTLITGLEPYYNRYNQEEKAISLLDIVFHISDKEGNLLLQSSRFNIINRYTTREDYVKSAYKFQNVSQEKMKLMDSGDIVISLDEVALKYGKLNDVAIIGNRDWIDSLKEIKLPIQNVKYAAFYSEKTDNKSLIQEFEEYRIEQDKTKDRINRFVNLSNEFRLNYNNKLKKTQCIFIEGNKKEKSKETEILSFKLREIEDTSRSYSEKLQKYSSSQICDVLCYLICNDLSHAQGLDTCYSLDAYNDSEADYIIKLLDNFTSIKFNPDANGWHFPSSEEIQKIDKKWNSEKTKKQVSSMLFGGGISSQDLLYIDESDILSGMFIIHTLK